MRAIQVIKGLNINDTAFEKIERTPEGIAIGGLPNWEFLVDPDYAETGWIRNRAKPNAKFNLIVNTANLTSDINLTKINGQNFLRSKPIAQGGQGQYRAESTNAKVNIDKNSFTIFTLIKQSPADQALTSPICVLRPTLDNVDGKLFVALLPGSGHLRIYNKSIPDATPSVLTPYRIAGFDTRLSVDSLKLVILTYSTEAGFNAYENGVHLGQAASSGVFDLEGGFGLFRTSHADWGLTGALNTVLSLPENAVHLQKLTSYLKQKYQIV